MMISYRIESVVILQPNNYYWHSFKVPSIRVANDSRELILNCCTEFIHLISSEANEVCNQRNKKTINAEHVLEALDRLGKFV